MAITLDGTAGITTPDLTDSSLTATNVVYAGTSGNLTGSANLTFDGTTLSSSIASAAAGLSLNSSTAGKANIVFKSAGTQKAIVGLAGAILGTSSTDLGLFAETGGAVKLFANGASTNSGTFNQYGFGIGAAVPSSGQGITFPAAQDASSNANTLDDYEEGTWTPTIIGSTTAGTATYLSTNGTYTKVGRVVTVVCYMQWQSHTGTGNMSVAGLPFTSVTHSAGSVGLAVNLALTAGKILLLYIGVGATTVRMVETPTGGGAFSDVPIDANVNDKFWELFKYFIWHQM
jgi:hypothetical protein